MYVFVALFSHLHLKTFEQHYIQVNKLHK